MTIDELNAQTRDAFTGSFGFLFEHSPWIVSEAAARRPFADLAAMEAAMTGIVQGADHGTRIKLLRAHPELAGKAAIDRMLTAASNTEQASAGLDRLTQAEFDRFHDLNARYRARFGFPFIICVRLTDKSGIIAAMENRLANDEEQEIAAALAEIARIVHLRLGDVVDG